MFKNTKINIVFGIVVLAVIVALSILHFAVKKEVITEYVPQVSENANDAVVLPTSTTTPTNSIKQDVVIDTSRSEPKIAFTSAGQLLVGGESFKLEFNDGEYLYDALHRLSDSGKISMIGKEYSGLGFFVDEINGLKPARGQSVIYYVNGKKATTGISTLKLHPGDIIEFKVEDNY